MELSGKVVIVTGASAGIGRALARELSTAGAKLSLLARREEALESCREECLANADVVIVPTDITRPEQCHSAVAATFDRFGRIDALVNCAGIGYFGPVETMRIADFERMLRTNVYGLLDMTQAALPYLKDSRGMIVNVSSAMSRRALPFLSAYAGTKAMVDRLTEGMRMELKPYGIHVLLYGPAETETELHERAVSGEGMRQERGPRRKMKSPAEVARGIVEAMKTDKREVMESHALMWMGLLAPGRTDAMFVKAMVEPMLGGDDAGDAGT